MSRYDIALDRSPQIPLDLSKIVKRKMSKEGRQTSDGRRRLAQEMLQPTPLSSAEYDHKYRERKEK